MGEKFTLSTASRKQAKLRLGVSGPSGSGKTYSALLVARGIASAWNKVVLIDTENGSGELYSDLGDYNVIQLEAPHSPERYIEAITAAEDAGMEVIIVDSISHEWEGKGGCLEINETLAAAKFKGNTWSAWSETTPRHQKFLNKITTSKAHVITTVRNKIDTVMGDDKKVKKVGTKEITREGFEYELTINFNVDRDTHLAMASKDRTNLFEKRDPFILTEEVGREIAAWNAGGAVDPAAQKREVIAELGRLAVEFPPEKHEVKAFIKMIIPKLTGLEWEPEAVPDVLAKLKTISAEDAAAALAPEPAPPSEAELASSI